MYQHQPSCDVSSRLVAKKAVELGLKVKPWVKTLAPGSKVVTDYLEKSGLLPYLDQLGFTIGLLYYLYWQLWPITGCN